MSENEPTIVERPEEGTIEADIYRAEMLVDLMLHSDDDEQQVRELAARQVYLANEALWEAENGA